MLDYNSAYSIVIPQAVSIYRYQYLTFELRVLCGFFICSAFMEIFNLIVLYTHIPNLWVMNLYTLTEGAIYFYVCGKWFNTKKEFRVVMGMFAQYFIYWIYT